MKEQILIQKIERDGYAYYVFVPHGPVDRFAERCRQIPRCVYEEDAQRWCIPAGQSTLRRLCNVFGPDSLQWTFELERTTRRSAAGGASREKDRFNLPPHWADRIHRVEEHLRVRRYSWRTIKSYLSHLRLFFAAHREVVPDDVDLPLIKRYIIERTERGNYANSTQNQLLNAIKFWMEHVEGREKSFIELRPRKEKRLPKVLSVDEVKRLLAAVENLKHRCILMIIYGGGLRLSEVCNLRIADIHSDRMQIFIHGGKGKKDRYTTLSHRALTELREYFTEYRPQYWLFEGQTGGQYSPRSVQMILRRAVDRSGVNPFATVHTLRHSYATHLMENGVSLRHIQDLMGHESSLTTEIYTHVSAKEKRRIVSPLDQPEAEE